MEEIKQMEISYHREMKSNYLMITVEETREQGFETRMLIGNTIDGLLKFRIRKSDNRCQFCYEITSKQPLGRLLETKSIGADQIRRLLLGIAQTLTRMEDYLLTEEQILLDPEFIYVDLENFQPGLCLMPGRKGDFPQEFSELLRFLLSKVDHQDKDAVVLVYGLYRESQKDNYGLDNLLRWLVKEDCQNIEQAKGDKLAEKPEKPRPSEAVPKMSYISEGRRDGTPGEAEVQEGKLTERAILEDERDSMNTGVFIKAKAPIKEILLCCCIVPIFLLFFWLRSGADGVYMFVTSGLLGGILLIAAIGIGCFVWRWRKNSGRYPRKPERIQQEAEADCKQQEEKAHASWEIVFDDEERIQKDTESPEDEDMHTVLLWSRETKEEQRRLIPGNRMMEPIVIAYYPFLLGKQENLVDYVLRDETVSRLHVRIDRTEGEYFLTDLNSTNGTSVNGKRLETNETVKIKLGDRIEIAHLGFYFQ